MKTNLKRASDWAQRLEIFLRENHARKFQYGRWDCCLFVADAIAAMTGSDVAAEFRGKYARWGEALRVMEAKTGQRSVAAIAAAVAEEFGMPEAAPGRAQRGDMALRRRPRGYSLGLVAMNGLEILFPCAMGMGTCPLSDATRVWHV